jgi:hypothetical protein
MHGVKLRESYLSAVLLPIAVLPTAYPQLIPTSTTIFIFYLCHELTTKK